ncbi:MAG TPA: dihydrofolate reductase [Pseudomonadales bacterium]|nr:dihydrofolate reductase [Pseudomonadales bacterium]
MPTSIVVARSRNNVIGNGNEIPWRVKGEQKLFKEITMGGILVMGRKTYDSIGRPLPGRETIIVTRNPEYSAEGCRIAPSLEAALELARRSDRPIYIVGGGEIYRQALPVVDAVHITTIETDVEGDVTFPDFPTSAFRLEDEQHHESNIDYTYKYYTRITDA